MLVSWNQICLYSKFSFNNQWIVGTLRFLECNESFKINSFPFPSSAGIFTKRFVMALLLLESLILGSTYAGSLLCFLAFPM